MHRYKAKIAHQKLMRKLESPDKLNEKEREELQKGLVSRNNSNFRLQSVVKEPPPLEEIHENLVQVF